MNQRPKLSRMVYPAAFLSLASLVWTTWSLVDLLGAGAVGLTVAGTADIVWSLVIWAEWRGVRLAGKRWTVPAIGWATLLTVVGFLVWHGIAQDNLAWAIAGPFLPLGAKVGWVLALSDMRDPSSLTDDQQHTLAEMERGLAFDEEKHRIEMRRRQMAAELQMAEVSVDFDIELMRMDKTRELNRRRPLELAGPAEEVEAELMPMAEASAVADLGRQEPVQTPANSAANSVFGFGAALTAKTPPVAAATSASTAPGARQNSRQLAAKRTARKPAKKAASTRRPMTEWVELAGPVFRTETASLGRQPSGPEFAAAIADAGLGTVSPSTAKNIRAEILSAN